MDNKCHSNGTQHETKMDNILHQKTMDKLCLQQEIIGGMRGCCKATKMKGQVGLFQALSGMPVIFHFRQILKPFVGQSIQGGFIYNEQHR